MYTDSLTLSYFVHILHYLQLARTEQAHLLDDEETDANASSPSGSTPRSSVTPRSSGVSFRQSAKAVASGLAMRPRGASEVDA